MPYCMNCGKQLDTTGGGCAACGWTPNPGALYTIQHSWKCRKCGSTYTEPENRPIPADKTCASCRDPLTERMDRIRQEFEIVAKIGHTACIRSAMLNVEPLVTEIRRLRDKLADLQGADDDLDDAEIERDKLLSILRDYPKGADPGVWIARRDAAVGAQ